MNVRLPPWSYSLSQQETPRDNLSKYCFCFLFKFINVELSNFWRNHSLCLSRDGTWKKCQSPNIQHGEKDSHYLSEIWTTCQFATSKSCLSQPHVFMSGWFSPNQHMKTHFRIFLPHFSSKSTEAYLLMPLDFSTFPKYWKQPNLAGEHSLHYTISVAWKPNICIYLCKLAFFLGVVLGRQKPSFLNWTKSDWIWFD